MTAGAQRRRSELGALWTACLFALTLSTGCKAKPTIEAGSEVRLHYSLKVDGLDVDSSRSGDPLSFTVGSGQIIPGLEEQIKGLKAGEQRQITVGPEKGYGPVRPEGIQKIPRKNFKDAPDIRPGITVSAQSNGQPIQAKVIAVDKNFVTVDMNHPMAGKTLNFDIEVVDVSSGKKG